MNYGDNRDHRKIDIFVAHDTATHGRYFAYSCSTTWAKTCREAKQKFYEKHYPKIGLKDIKARFSATK